ncbi:protein of unknown function [Eubacterium ruminantium]|nr:protein of unknown function [Eubacterium ruminantium]
MMIRKKGNALNEKYGEWYQELRNALGTMQENDIYDDMNKVVGSGRSNISMNRKLMEKSIDVSWVEAIENGLIHVDNVIRRPSRTIVDVEEIVPIALSRKVTVESVKHLAQHTDLIQSIDKKTGRITPSKLLNVHKEESLETYENRFVNTLIDRLYIFIMTRYEKLAEVEKDEEVYTMEMENEMDDSRGNLLNFRVSIDSRRSLEAANDSGYTIWQRVEKLKKTIEGYKGSELCMTLGNNFVQPPIMRTNAIMKNVDLKACLVLWQYILSYDKVGYEINIEDTALKPEQGYMDDLVDMITCDMLLFKSYTDKTSDVFKPIGKRKFKSVQPKVVKRYKAEVLSGHYGIHTDGAVGYIEADGPLVYVNNDLPDDIDGIFNEIDNAINIERNFYAEKERKRLEELAIQEEAERRKREREERLAEKRRIEALRLEERERIRREKEEEEKRVQELLARRRAEIEAEERERERQAAERKARIEEEKRLAEEAAREEAERKKREENEKSIRSGFGEAEGVDTAVFDRKKEERDRTTATGTVTQDDIEQAEEIIQEQVEQRNITQQYEPEDGKAAEPQEEIIEDPREVAVRMKLEQQKKEKELREKERALRLKAKRKEYEAKPFDEIRKAYSKNPIYAIPRFFRWLLFVLFGIIPKDTDNPDQQRILAERAEKARREEYEKTEREKFDAYYKKYATNFPYNIKRFIADTKFKRKKKKADKLKPKPVFNPPKRTEEETRAIEMQMKSLYKTYHVGPIKRFRRFLHDRKNEGESV